ncbi:hypothetical protein CRENBAI_026565 [Crenichthys baileyi]|uniref:Uncharacterized protein n=1 Tax=Crenichthys baileyi TaxID=28760 RepID=A0AAV9S9R1_9TELE
MKSQSESGLSGRRKGDSRGWEEALVNGSGSEVCCGCARMGCTVSFICCEEDFLQMPLYQHEDEKKKEPVSYVKAEEHGGTELFFYLSESEIFHMFSSSELSVKINGAPISPVASA